MRVGEWIQDERSTPKKRGKPLSPKTIDKHLAALRVFFRECQEWDWITRRFDPRRCFGTPRSVRALIGPDPRIIADDVWAKLLWAGLNLSSDDLPAATGLPRAKGNPWYPLEMVRAMVVVWLFAGLRRDEFRRLRVGCVRWQYENVPVPGMQEVLRKNAICWLDVPIHKTGTAFTKAVDGVVGEAIEAWERVRPSQPISVDPKTGEMVHYVFAYRAKQIGLGYLNDSLIPLLCRKAGVPEYDARGDITSHRARSTIASQLYNAKEPLSLFDLQEWLGHRLLSSTQYYAKKSPTKVAKAYEKAGYFERNLRMVEVLIDQDVIKNGQASVGEPWRFYDLGHGYCLYDFFDQCPHRMACAKCSFYRAKGSSQAQLLEGKANLLRMLQEIPLSEEERAAVEDGIVAMEKLCQQLTDVPTPAGPTPNQLREEQQGVGTIIPVEQVRRKQAGK
jgi:integrase